MATCALPQFNTKIKAAARLCTTSVHSEKMHLYQDTTEIFVAPFQHCTLIYSVSGSGTGRKYLSTKDYLKSLVIYHSLILL